MSIQIQCPSCSAIHRVARPMLGRTLSCPSCAKPIKIPTQEAIDASLRETGEFPGPTNRKASDELEDTVDFDEDGLADRQTLVDGVQVSIGGDPEDDRLGTETTLQGIGVGGEPSPRARADAVHDFAQEEDGHTHHLPVAVTAAEDDGAEPPPLQRKKRAEDELDMTPMVDVTFLLLIFFMVTASFSLQKTIGMPRSQSDQPSTNTEEQEEEDFETVTVEIDQFNGFLIVANEFERECTSKLAVTTALKEAYNTNAGGMRLAIVCHKKANLQSLVDVMDAGRIANFGELEITEVDELN